MKKAGSADDDGHQDAGNAGSYDGVGHDFGGAGGYANGETLSGLKEKGLDLLFTVLVDNDAYHALKAVDSLIITGLTRTNVNDVAVALLKR